MFMNLVNCCLTVDMFHELEPYEGRRQWHPYLLSLTCSMVRLALGVSQITNNGTTFLQLTENKAG